jgi:hypothetical protein
VPGYRGAITRSQKVVVRALDIRGKEIRVRAEDNLLAEALEHEVDHVNGILYVDRLDSMDDLFKLDGTDWATAQPVSSGEPPVVGAPHSHNEHESHEGHDHAAHAGHAHGEHAHG